MIRLPACLLLLATFTMSLCNTAIAVDKPANDDAGGWTVLFDGTSLDGWKINEHPETWTLADGILTCKGERSHIFYVGDEAPFKDFELELEILTHPNSNSGVYFHTRYQDDGWPKGGFECQVNNTYNSDPRKTGSLYAVKDVLEAPAKDNEWWTYNIRVEGHHVTIRVNGKVVNEYTQSADTQPGKDFERVFSGGTFALQGHDPGSTVSYRSIKVKRLNEEETAGVKLGGPAPKFTLIDQDGKEWNAAEHFAKGTTVVYFYPADFTGGCTKQACAYRDDNAKLTGMGIQVVGISGDSPETHTAFAKAHNLNFTLLSDPQGKVATAFGVPATLGEKTASFEGTPFVRTATIQRWTFVVKDGKVIAINDKVNAADDSQQVQEQIKALN
ncbi:MAG: family 16 glycoside hydrolase [Planctomycetaceae bacterium]